ncbi:unnamed protein product [Parascedosporium putredinis]|uniref:Fe2OG dioxygenase domain-containing protein n=1 Tax=Parascedosporium putredinis TaxID=1442378 RepID=A0A9P1MEN1_9PEZI|nr:unnamed protein product [Parascedosporium putredinis]CAI8004934.1 unnamed protein product [Parascedosporium putredinis]
MAKSRIRAFLAATALLARFASAEAQDQIPLSEGNGEAAAPYTCTHPPYKIHLFSQSPLVIYIAGFLTPDERAHLLHLAGDTFTHSAINTSNGTTISDSIRTSSSTTVALDDPVVQCIESRALAFQGLPGLPRSHLEPIQLVRYAAGEHYHFHTDWFVDPAHSTARFGGQRTTSFFGYVGVGDGTTGGGTNFPVLDIPDDDPAWCRFVDCDEARDRGVTFRPIEGNVVFWQNVGPDGLGDDRTLHAGLPVTSGWKVGMNIWTREGPLGRDVRGEAAWE